MAGEVSTAADRIRKLALRAAEQRADLLGTDVIFRGVRRRWKLETPRPDTNESAIGTVERIDLLARAPSSLQPAPRRGEEMIIVATKKKLRVLHACPADGNDPMRAEHLITLVSA